jgi:integrase
VAAWRELDLLFPTGNGTPMTVSNFHKEYRASSRQQRCPISAPHDLRHIAATLLLLKGLHPKMVSEMLGHSSVAIALSIYSHVPPSMHRDAATAMDELFAQVTDKRAR